MKTLIFCTSYCTSIRSWEDRIGTWIRSLNCSDLHFDQLLIVDDASPVLPSWPDLAVIHEGEAPHPHTAISFAPILLYTHMNRLGRQSIVDFPGWHRSFAFGALYGAAHGFERIIHIESDAHLISARIQSYFNNFEDGWTCLWCRKYEMPEIAIQVAAGVGVSELISFAREPYERYAGNLYEKQMPFRFVEQTFIGDRYGETLDYVPEDADFSAQTHAGLEQAYYWWIKDESRWPIRRRSVFRALPPFAREMLSGDWAESEPTLSWMIKFDSSIALPPVSMDGIYDLELDVTPAVLHDRIQQRLVIYVNGRFIRELSLKSSAKITLALPAGLLNTYAPNAIRIFHPDSFAPCEVSNHSETRSLSVALTRCELFFRPAITPQRVIF